MAVNHLINLTIKGENTRTFLRFGSVVGAGKSRSWFWRHSATESRRRNFYEMQNLNLIGKIVSNVSEILSYSLFVFACGTSSSQNLSLFYHTHSEAAIN